MSLSFFSGGKMMSFKGFDQGNLMYFKTFYGGKIRVFICEGRVNTTPSPLWDVYLELNKIGSFTLGRN